MFRADAMAQFERWLHKQQQQADDGGEQFTWSKVELRPVTDDDGEAMGYGIFARENIRLNETAIKVPERTMITAGRVAEIGEEYAEIMQRIPLEPSEVLALFFCFERVHFDYFCDQLTLKGPFSVQWPLDIPSGFARFMKMRRKRQQKSAEDAFWWRPYLGILPLRFGTPLFRHYLEGSSGVVRLRCLADKLPQEAKNTLLGQLAELRKLEKKIFVLLYASKFGQKTTNWTDKTFESDFDGPNFFDRLTDKVPKESVEFWREMCCWAWHVVNTRCIFVSNLPFHPLVDCSHLEDGDGGNLRRRGKMKGRKKQQRMRRTTDGTETAEVNGYGSAQEEDEEDDYGGSLAIVPLVDMLNHSTDAQCVAMFDHKHSHQYLVRADRHFVPAGRQLFVCYGAHDNARLWVEYGFRIENSSNPFNRVALPRDLFIALAERCGVRLSEKRREVLQKANLCCTIYATDEMPSFSLRKSCAILLLERDKLQNWSQHIFGDDHFEEEDDEQQQKRSESLGRQMELLTSILDHLQKALEGRRENCAIAEGENGKEERKKRGEQEEEEMAIVASFWEDQIQIVRRMAQNLADISTAERRKDAEE